MGVLNVARNFINPAYAPEMMRKLKLRVFGQARDGEARSASTEWCQSVETDVEEFATHLSPELWEEAKQCSVQLRELADKRLSQLDVDLGGGGHYPLLYFVTRLRRPFVVVETGVGAGYSSQAILKALHLNRHGHLYSSEFPYIRMKDPEQFVGILVENELKSRWSLYLRGDRRNIKVINSSVGNIELFHYDSDKSYLGRSEVLPMRWARIGVG